MNISENLVELINSPDRITILSTTDADGTPNTAIIGSALMTEDNHIWLGLADNRTSKNMRTGGKAVLLVVRSGQTVLDWKGGRLYLELAALETEGARFDRMIDRIRTTAGRMAARSIRHLAICQISEVRPLAEFV